MQNKNLNHRQLDRIQAIRDRRLERMEERQRHDLASLATLELGEEERGRVVAHYGLNVLVADQGGGSCRCAVRENLAENPVCGDLVIWRRGSEGQGVIEAIQPRRNVLRRPGFHGRLQTLAANVDQMVITTAADQPNPGLVDRYLIAAEMHHIEPLILVNKADLEHDEKELKRLLKSYRDIGYRAMQVSSLAESGLDKLEKRLADKISIFVGMSGVGKSSLVARWAPDQGIRVGEVNPGTGKGRHVTTVARVYPLPDGGSLIDSPGIRSFGLFGMPSRDVPLYFREIAPLITSCHFSDCGHLEEPGCQVIRAVEKGRVDARRFDSMHRIMDSMPD